MRREVAVSSPLRRAVSALCAVALVAAGLTGCAAESSEKSDGHITVYSGRVLGLVGRVVKNFEDQTGIKVHVRYGATDALARRLSEQKGAGADVFLTGEAAPLAQLSQEHLLAQLPKPVQDKVPSRYRGRDGRWVGVTGWTQALVYNTRQVPSEQVPQSVYDLADPRWRGKVGIDPNTRPFHTLITAMRVTDGEQRAQQFLADLRNNGALVEPSPHMIIDKVNSGQLQLGLISNYDWYQRRDDHNGGTSHTKTRLFGAGDLGQVVNTSAVGVLSHVHHDADVRHFVAYLLSREPQRHFTNRTYEYPLAADTAPAAGMPSFSTLHPPKFNLDSLADKQPTLQMIATVFPSTA